MSIIGFVPDEISMILELLSAILNLGNIEFAPKNEFGTPADGCMIQNEERKLISGSTWRGRKICKVTLYHLSC